MPPFPVLGKKNALLPGRACCPRAGPAYGGRLTGPALPLTRCRNWPPRRDTRAELRTAATARPPPCGGPSGRWCPPCAQRSIPWGGDGLALLAFAVRET